MSSKNQDRQQGGEGEGGGKNDENENELNITVEWVEELTQTFTKTASDPSLFPLNENQVTNILLQYFGIVQQLPNVVDVCFDCNEDLAKEQSKAIGFHHNDGGHVHLNIVGDLHGQFFDLMHMFEINGRPSECNPYLFLGDYVDRGSWAVEVLLTLFCYKILYPNHVHMLRGNHETQFCSVRFGFFDELSAKINEEMYSLFQMIFQNLPVAAVVSPFSCYANEEEEYEVGQYSILNGSTDIDREKSVKDRKQRICCLHGGLFRNKKQKRNPGMLSHLLEEERSVEPHNGDVLDDLLWSDPIDDGDLRRDFRENQMRGTGIEFGQNYTGKFLQQNECVLVVRAHEGPDARIKREARGTKMGGMMDGFSLDHETDDGMLLTVFSAPNYPQGELAHGNAGCTMRLHSGEAIVIDQDAKPDEDDENLYGEDIRVVREVDVTDNVKAVMVQYWAVEHPEVAPKV